LILIEQSALTRSFASTKLKSSRNLTKRPAQFARRLCDYLKTGRGAFAYSSCMALQQALSSERECGLQRGMERQIIALLHRAHKPGALASLPIMHSLCLATGESNPVAALERIVCSTLPDDEPNGMSLRGAILDADFKRSGTNGQLAQMRGLSRRHFQRLRAEAVARIARRVRRIADAPALAKAAVRQHRPPEGDWRFELEREAFRDAQARGNSLEMRCIAGNLLRLAPTNAARSFAWDCRADANLRLGYIGETLDHFEILSEPARHAVRAKLALLDGNFEEAEARALAGIAIAQDDRARFSGLALLSQIRLERAQPWDAPNTGALPQRSWERCAMESERSRHLVVRGEWREGERLALATYDLAATHGYREVAARCAAVLTAAAQERGYTYASNHWRANAIAQLLPTLDRVAATGLFLRKSCSGAGGLGDALIDVLYERLCLVVPPMQRDDSARRAVVCKLLADAVEGALRTAPMPALEVALCPSHYLEPVAEMLALAVSAFARLPWSVALERLRYRLKSQQALIEHLSIDDGLSIRRARGVEAFTDLRVRLVSV